jgi:hypothetical protein
MQFIMIYMAAIFPVTYGKLPACYYSSEEPGSMDYLGLQINVV